VQLRFAERVIDGENGAAGIAEEVAHAKTRERLAKYFRTGELHRVLTSGDRKAPTHSTQVSVSQERGRHCSDRPKSSG